MMTKNTLIHLARRPVLSLIITVVIALLALDRGFQAQGVNPIPTENGTQTGVAASGVWDIAGAGDLSIQGFATDISVNTGQTVTFKIKTDSSNYAIDIYRLGYYGGAGARRVAQVAPSVVPQNQPACLQDAATGLTDCGNWAPSASWSTAGQVSGIYVAKLNRADGTLGSSHIVFVVRDDARKADVVVQTSDTTWQAYNRYGTGSLYCGGPVSNAGSAYASSCVTRSSKVSYNRPITTRANDPQSFVFNAEYPMVRWLEANGYNVKYVSGVDTDRFGSALTGAAKPKIFLSSGHDEYWSAGQRAAVEAARGAGVNLAFFSGNEMYWKTRYEASIDGTSTAYRTLVSYKDTLAGVKLDPMLNVATGTWRDLRFAPPVADGGRPENAVTGAIWTVNQTPLVGIQVPAAMANHRFWRNAALPFDANGIATLTQESLGYEWDEDLDNGFRPAGLTHLSSTTVSGLDKIIDFGATTGPGTGTHSLLLYRHSSGALVFGAGTVQWSWGLDSNHDRGSAASQADHSMQQATMNLLADMGAQPASVQPGLTATAGSLDTVAPTSTISSPAAGATVSSGNHLTITGTATDTGGVVAGVEVSVDGGTTWHPATGRATWTYDWVPGAQGPATIKSRAADDSGNIEAVSAGNTVTVGAGSTNNPMIFPGSPTPAVLEVPGETNPVELGLKFRSDSNSVVTGVRFYKSAANVGTHVGNLWTLSGALIASANFANESLSGWQTASFAAPVTLTAGTTYVVSYHTNVGHYSADGGYFGTAGVDSSPFHAPDTASGGGNGVFAYGGIAFPTQTFNATNYWVDIVGAGPADTTPPVISDFRATTGDVQAGTASAIVTWNTTEQATSRIDYSTVTTFPAAQTVTVADPSYVSAHSVALTGLAPSTQYYFRISSADRAGNVGTLAICPPGVTCGSAGGSTPPLGYLMPGPTMRDTTTADFSAGASAGTYISEVGDPQGRSAAGEIVLAPAVGDEFSGSTLSAGWTANLWQSGGAANVGGGKLTVSGALVAGCSSAGVCSSNLTAGHSVEFVATFTGDLFQHAGFGQTFNVRGEPFAIFSTVDASGTNPDGSLFARTSDGVNETVTSLGPGLLGVPHRFRIDWNAGNVSYWVDGIPALAAPAYSVNVVHQAVAGPMRVIAASEYRGLSGTVVVDWTRLTPYSASGSYTSRVFDAGVKTSWQSLTSGGNASTGTVAFSVRMSNDGSTWTAFAPFAAGAQSRFIQYRAALTTSDPNQTPEIDDVTITGAAVPPVVLAMPSVTFTGAPATAAFGSSFTVASTTNASTPAVITATGACSIAGNLVKMTSGTGTCSLSASWAADSIFLAATATQSTTASKINPTTTAVVASASTSNYGQLITLTGTITGPAGVGGPTGTVTYNDVITLNNVASPQTTIGSAALSGSNALYSTFMLSGGKHSVTVSYGGDSNYNGSNSSLIIVTVIPVGIASVNPTSVAFPSQPVGITSMAMPVAITNIGNANLTFSGIQISGDNPDDFAISSNTCGSILTMGASCVVNVKFKPMATGTRTASLMLTDNDNGIAGSKQPISLVGSSLSVSKANFTGKPMAAGRTLWFASEFTLAKGPRDGNNVYKDMKDHPVRVLVTNGVITFTANGVNYSLPVPDAMVTFSPLVTKATTTFDAASNRWLTTVPAVHPTSRKHQFEIDGRIFATGVPMPVPVGGLPGGIQNVTWSAAYTTDTPGLQLQWKWGAAVYSSFGADYNALKVKPMDAVRGPWALMLNDDPAGTPEGFRQFFLPNGGGTADDADDFTGDQTPNVGVVPDVAQANIAPIPVVFPGDQAAGTTSAPITATITNNHQTIPLIVSSLSLVGTDFTVVGGTCSMTSPTTLVGGASCTVSLTFSPKDMGTRAGSLNIGFSTPPGIAADEAPLPYKLDIVGTGK